jgi:hypothetical protein
MVALATFLVPLSGYGPSGVVKMGLRAAPCHRLRLAYIKNPHFIPIAWKWFAA